MRAPVTRGNSPFGRGEVLPLDAPLYQSRGGSEDMEMSRTEGMSVGSYSACFIALLIASIAPIWMVTLPPLADYPNHLARMHILANISSSEDLQRFYEIRWGIIPNLAMDLIVPRLSLLVPLPVAGKLFLSATLALLSTGATALHYAIFRRLSAWPLIAFLFLYNGIFLFGIVNFLFGLGIALWGLAAWIRFREASGWLRAAMFYAVTLILFFAHLSALGVYAICVLAYEVAAYAERKSGLGWLAIYAAAPLALLLLLASAPGANPGAAPPFEYGPLPFAASQKIGAFALLLRNYVSLLDLLTLGLMVWIAAFGWMSRQLVIDRRMIWPVAAVALAFLAMPYQVMQSNFADARLLVAVAFLIAATIEFRPGNALGRFFLIALFGLFGVRMAVLVEHWSNAERVHAEYQDAISQLKPGSRLLMSSVRDPQSHSHADYGPHIAALAVMEKAIFLPSMYAMPRGQPIVFSREYLALAESAPKPDQWAGEPATWQRVLRDYDFVIVAGVDRFAVPPPARLQAVFAGTGFTLFKTPRH